MLNFFKNLKNKKLFDIHAPVFYPAVILIVLFLTITLGVGKPMKEIFSTIQTGISDNAGWFLIIAVNFFLIFCLYIAFGKFGHIRLGGEDAKPEFSLTAWFAMLFSAGMGIGIMFYGVGEPVSHFLYNPLASEGQTAESAAKAMQLSFLHWGLHAWAIYALVGMSLAYFAFNKKLPLTIRSVFYPVLGKRIYGWQGNLIDVLAVVATLFGLTSSLGVGVKQVGAGLEYLFDIPNTEKTQIILIALITVAATLSVATGLKKGVKILSQLNLNLAAVFLLVILVVGPTLFIFDSFLENLGGYLQNFFTLSFWSETYVPDKFAGGEYSDWQNGWTILYWAWWISWSPFVGTFIATISKGRTVKEFVLGVLIIPSLLTFLWLSAFGGSAIFLELNQMADIGTAVKEDVSTSLFVLLEQFPFASISSFVAIILVMSFFVTSSDSGSLVIDSITAGGKHEVPVAQRIFWAVTEGVVAAVLLYGGGLAALQTATIIAGLPFAFVLILMAFSLLKGLREEKDYLEEQEQVAQIEAYTETIIEEIGERIDNDELDWNKVPTSQN
jgi:choline/glycine/proline betaine transport protein